MTSLPVPPTRWSLPTSCGVVSVKPFCSAACSSAAVLIIFGSPTWSVTVPPGRLNATPWARTLVLSKYCSTSAFTPLPIPMAFTATWLAPLSSCPPSSMSLPATRA
ncbi:hypothetical protein D3C81_1251710 [compost metagenome]